MKTIMLSLLCFIAGLFFIILNGHSSTPTEIILKALIIPPLIFVMVANRKPVMDRIDMLVIAGLLFSWFGDVVLMFTFVPGLICFLIAHVMYLFAFFKTPGKNAVSGRGSWRLIPIIIAGIGLIWFLYDDLGEMRLPVIIYSVVILTMVAGAVNRLKKVNRLSFWIVLAGAVLFVISDSAIAINKFSLPFRFSSIVIMSTYIIAQFLIVTGYIRQYREKLA